MVHPVTRDIDEVTETMKEAASLTASRVVWRLSESRMVGCCLRSRHVRCAATVCSEKESTVIEAPKADNTNMVRARIEAATHSMIAYVASESSVVG